MAARDTDAPEKLYARLQAAAAVFVLDVRLSDLEDYWLECRCSCGRSSFPALKLMAIRHGGNMTLGSVIQRFVCAGCKAKPAAVYLNERHNREFRYGGPPGWSVRVHPPLAKT